MGLLADYMPNWLPNDPNQNQAARQGLLQFGAALLGGKGNFGSILGQGIQAGAGGYNSSLQALQQKALLDAQTQHLGYENQAAKGAIDQNNKISAGLEQFNQPGPSAATSLVTGTPAPLSALPQMSVDPNAKPLSSIPQASAAPDQPVAPVSALPQVGAPAAPVADPMAGYKKAVATAQYLNTNFPGSKQAENAIKAVEALKPKVKETRVVTLADGKTRALANIFDDPSIPPQILQGVNPDLEKLAFGSTGGNYTGSDPFTGKVVSSTPMTATPGELIQHGDQVASRAQAERHWQADQKDANPVPTVSNGLSGDKFLSSLDKPTADQVKALAEGRLAFPTGKGLQSEYWQKMISAVAQYDPSFDAVNYGARAKTRNDLVAGKGAENIKAINTAISHMGQLDQQLTALNNTSSPAYNTAANFLGTHVFPNSGLQTRVASVNATAEGVAGEMAKVFRSTGMSEHEINAWRQKFADNTTPGAQRGTMQSAMHMLQGRMEAIQDQYRTGMGTTAQPLRILTPQSQAVFDRLAGTKAAEPAPVAALPQKAPVTVTGANDYAALPSGTLYVAPDGHTRRKP